MAITIADKNTAIPFGWNKAFDAITNGNEVPDDVSPRAVKFALHQIARHVKDGSLTLDKQSISIYNAEVKKLKSNQQLFMK